MSCTGGITDQRRWIRLFPVPYRFLTDDKRFRKYQWIEVRCARSPSDDRPESYRLDSDSIRVLSDPLPYRDKWQARKDLVFPLMAPSLCHLQRTRAETGVSLGFLRPRTISRLEIESEEDPDWTPEEGAKLAQLDLFGSGPSQPLEKIPCKFYYHFTCDEPDCNGHRLSCVDWELGQAYRSWRGRYGDQWEWAIRRRFESEMIELCDTCFYVGTVRAHPDSWIIVGLFYPRR